MTTLSVVGGTKRRRYTKRQKVTAIIAADMTSTKAVARESGVPESTLRYWMDDPTFAPYRAKTREDLAEGALALAQETLAKIRERLPEFEPRDLTILLGVLTDKAQLLTGHATERTEHRDITDTLSPEAVDALADDVDEWLRKRAVDAPA